MNLPGFAAEASLSKSGQVYRGYARAGAVYSAGTVQMALTCCCPFPDGSGSGSGGHAYHKWFYQRPLPGGGSGSGGGQICFDCPYDPRYPNCECDACDTPGVIGCTCHTALPVPG